MADKKYYKISKSTLVDIADAIRERLGTTDDIQVSNMASLIMTITNGGTLDKVLSSITATKTTTTYEMGDVLGFDDVVVTATYSDGTSSEVTGWASNSDTLDSSAAGTITLTISYTEGEVTKTANVTITINDSGAVTVDIEYELPEATQFGAASNVILTGKFPFANFSTRATKDFAIFVDATDMAGIYGNNTQVLFNTYEVSGTSALSGMSIRGDTSGSTFGVVGSGAMPFLPAIVQYGTSNVQHYSGSTGYIYVNGTKQTIKSNNTPLVVIPDTLKAVILVQADGSYTTFTTFSNFSGKTTQRYNYAGNSRFPVSATTVCTLTKEGTMDIDPDNATQTGQLILGGYCSNPSATSKTIQRLFSGKINSFKCTQTLPTLAEINAFIGKDYSSLLTQVDNDLESNVDDMLMVFQRSDYDYSSFYNEEQYFTEFPPVALGESKAGTIFADYLMDEHIFIPCNAKKLCFYPVPVEKGKTYSITEDAVVMLSSSGTMGAVYYFDSSYNYLGHSPLNAVEKFEDDGVTSKGWSFPNIAPRIDGVAYMILRASYDPQKAITSYKVTVNEVV